MKTLYGFILVIIFITGIIITSQVYHKLRPQPARQEASREMKNAGSSEGLALPKEQPVPSADTQTELPQEYTGKEIDACRQKSMPNIISDIKLKLRRKNDMVHFDDTVNSLNDYYSCLAYKELKPSPCDKLADIWDSLSMGLDENNINTLKDYVKLCKKPNAAMSAYAAGYDKDPRIMDFIANYLADEEGLNKNKVMKDLADGIDNLYKQNNNEKELMYDFPKSAEDCRQYCEKDEDCKQKCRQNIEILNAFRHADSTVCVKNKDKSHKYSRCYYMFHREDKDACEEEKDKVINSYCKPLLAPSTAQANAAQSGQSASAAK